MAALRPQRPGDASAARINGIDLEQAHALAEQIRSDAARAKLRFQVNTRWTGQTRAETVVDHFELGGNKIDRRFKMVADEPLGLGGQDSAPNPQEMLLAALNSCMMIGYVTGAALRGIELDHLEIETHGELDARGFMGLDNDVQPGCERLDYTVRVRANATEEELCAIHRGVLARSPNYFDLSQPIAVTGRLEILPLSNNRDIHGDEK